MILNIAQIIVEKFEKNELLKAEKEIYKYGLAMMISYLIGASIIILFGIITSQIVHSFIYLLLFDKLRSDTGGYHANTYTQCNLLFVSSFVFHLIVISNIKFHFLFLLSIIALISIYSFIPIEHPNNKLTEKNKIVSKNKSLKKFLLALILSVIFNAYCLIGNAICSIIIIITFFGFLQMYINERRKENEIVA